MSQIDSVVIIGDGVSAWLAAAILKKNMANLAVTVVGKLMPVSGAIATTEMFSAIETLLGINREQLIFYSDATFRLATSYQFDQESDKNFIHPLSGYGDTQDVLEFHQYASLIKSTVNHNLDNYSLGSSAVKAAKFSPVISAAESEIKPMIYGLHVNLVAMLQFIIGYAKHLGVLHINEDCINSDPCDSATLTGLKLSNGGHTAADFYIDCGKKSLLHDAADCSYETWLKFFPYQQCMDITLDSRPSNAPTSIVKLGAGYWLKEMPIRSGTAVSIRADTQDVLQEVVGTLSSRKIKSQIQYAIKPGMRNYFWKSNYLAIGKAACEFDDILVPECELVMLAVSRLLRLWPDKSFNETLIAEYNRLMALSYESVRDFHSLHYWLFYPALFSQQYRLSPLLAEELQLYMQTTRLKPREYRYVPERHWFSLLVGMNRWPEKCTNISVHTPSKFYTDAMDEWAQKIRQEVAAMPPHTHFLNAYLKNFKKTENVR